MTRALVYLLGKTIYIFSWLPNNSLGDLFSVIYAIYFGVTVGASGRFHGFDTAAIFACDSWAIVRLPIAVLLLNVAPFLYYLLFHYLVVHTPDPPAYSLCSDVSVLFLALGGAGFYRIFAGLMYCKVGDDFVWYAPKSLRSGFRTSPDEYATRECRFPLCYDRDFSEPHSPPSATNHIGGGVLWLTICIAPFICTHWQSVWTIRLLTNAQVSAFILALVLGLCTPLLANFSPIISAIRAFLGRICG